MKLADLARPDILALRPYSSARSEAPADGVLLNANESPRPLLDWAGEGVSSLNRYPDPQPAKLVRALADVHAVDPERVLVTRGSDEGIDLLTRVFCRAGEDRVLECPPCFGMYRVAAAIQGAAVVSVPRDRERDWAPDIDALVAALETDAPPKLVFLTSPNNPTGDVLARADLERVLDAARDRALVVLDEAYIEFCPGAGALELQATSPHLVILRTLSKAWASAGLRCGVVLADPGVIGLLKRVIAPYPLAAPVVSLALATLGPEARAAQRELVREVLQQKTRLLELLDSTPAVRRIRPGAATFVLAEVDDAPALVRHCRERGVLVRAFSDPLLAGCVRITVGNPQELDALATALDAPEAVA